MEEVGATLGETQRFECQVIGFPTPSIRWFKDEIDITNNERYQVGLYIGLGRRTRHFYSGRSPRTFPPAGRLPRLFEQLLYIFVHN